MDENLEWLTQNTEDLKSNKGDLTPPPIHTVNVIELQSNKKVTTPHFYINLRPFSGLSPFLVKNFIPPSDSIFRGCYPPFNKRRGGRGSNYESNLVIFWA